MTVASAPTTDQQRKSVVLDYLRRLDTGRDLSDLFADDAVLYFPKWGLAKGIDQIKRCFAETGSMFDSIEHHYAELNFVLSGGDVVVVEGTSHGRHRDGPWQAGTPEWGAGRWCDVFEIRDSRIHRLFIYLDPDYANQDVARYPWLDGRPDVAAAD